MSPQDPLLQFLVQSRISFLTFFLTLTDHHLQEASPYTPQLLSCLSFTAMQPSSFPRHVGASSAHVGYCHCAGQVTPALLLLHSDELHPLQQPVPLVLGDVSC